MAPFLHSLTEIITKRSPLDSSSPLTLYLDSISLAEREALTRPSWKRSTNEPPTPLQARRAPPPTGQPSHNGAINPTDINNKGVQAVFAIIGCSFVLAIIWFFFIAKNGGFVFRKGDWEEYKSTVLRRKGPDGKTLSNATKSTRLGGGSVVGSGYSDQDTETGYGDDASTVYTGTMSELSSSTAPIIKDKNRAARSEKSNNPNRNRQHRGETNKERKQREMAQADFEGGHDRDVRAYMREKPARVGGLNSHGDTLHFGTDYTASEPAMSQTAANPYSNDKQERRRTSRSPEKRNTNINSNQTRRDFSYTTNPQQEQDQFTTSSVRSPSPPPLRVPAPAPAPPRYHHPTKPAPVAREPMTNSYTIGNDRRTIPGSFPTQYAQPLNVNGNTRSYHHPLPGLSGQTGRNAGNGGFRRGMGGGLDD